MRLMEKISENETSPSKVRSGLTSASFLALLYSVLIFQPAMIWLNLAAGTQLGSVGWISLIIFVELARMLGKRLTRQEATVIFLLSGMGWSMAGAPFFIERIYRAYYAQSEIAVLFNLHDKIPPWWASLDRNAWLYRTFLHPSWYTPLLLGVAILLLGEAVNISMGLIMRQIFVKEIKLPFPMQEVSVVGIINVTERAGRQRDILLFGAIGSMLYTFAIYGPTFIYEILGYPAGEPPIPWVDFSPGIQRLLPGACFGIATDLLYLVNGFILPFNIVMSIFIGSIAIYLVGNPLLIHLNLTEFAKEYFHGMKVAQIMYRSNLYAWAGPMVGVSFAAGIIPLYLRRHAIVDAFKVLSRSEATRDVMSLPVLLGVWLAASVASVIIAYSLVPVGVTYLLIMLGMSIAWSFVWTLINTYSLGVTGVQLSPPQTILPIIKYSYISLGRAPYDIWFIDPIIGVGGTGWCGSFYIADRTSTDIKSYIKTFLIMLPIIFLAGFFYVQNFWKMAPIPSIMFRNTSIFWPIRAVNDSLWITGKMFHAFDPMWILGAFLLTLGVSAIIHILKLPANIIAIAAGVGTAIPIAVTILLGGIIGKIIQMRMGADWWRENRMTLSAGIAIGSATMLTLLSVITMMSKSLWVMPY